MMNSDALKAAVELAQQLGAALAAHNLTCASAESCTGGLIGHLITEIPGSSAYFAGAAVVYSYAAKERVLNVEHATLARCGAVSAEVAAQMAQGARRLYEVDVAVSVTGIAGPGGSLPGKPTGTVYLHVSGAVGYERSAHQVWPGDRSANKLLSAVEALRMVLEYVAARG